MVAAAPDTYLIDVVTRIKAMCEECIANSDASFDPLYTNEQYPYWVISLDEYEPTEDSEDLSIRPYTFTIQYIVGVTGGGYAEQNITQLYQDEPKILNFFMQRRNLQSTTYPDKCDYLQPGTDTAFVRTAGIGSYARSGLNISVYGTVFQLRTIIEINIDQIYL